MPRMMPCNIVTPITHSGVIINPTSRKESSLMTFIISKVIWGLLSLNGLT